MTCREHRAGAVVFDLDDTLCDYTGAKLAALHEVLGEFLGADPGRAVRTFTRSEPELFGQMLRKSMTLSEYRYHRFATVLRQHGRALSDEPAVVNRLNSRFMDLANNGVRPVTGMVEALTFVRSAGYATAVLTNGPSDGQRAKIAALGLGDLVDSVHISAECGVAKPDAAAFRCVLRQLAVPAHRAVMLGDDARSDVAAARAAGLHGVAVGNSGAAGERGRSLVEGTREALAILEGQE